MVGPSIGKTLAEELAIEKRANRTPAIHADMLVSASRENAVEQVARVKNPAVRRTAIYLLREFGAQSAAGLTTLLDDTEPTCSARRCAPFSRSVRKKHMPSSSARWPRSNQTGKAHHGAVSMRSERTIPSSNTSSGTSITKVRSAASSTGGGVARSAEARVPSICSRRHSTQRLVGSVANGELRGTAANALLQIDSAEAVRVLQKAQHSGPRAVRAAIRAVQS